MADKIDDAFADLVAAQMKQAEQLANVISVEQQTMTQGDDANVKGCFGSAGTFGCMGGCFGCAGTFGCYAE